MALLIGDMTLKLSTDCRVSEMFWQREICVVNIALPTVLRGEIETVLQQGSDADD